MKTISYSFLIFLMVITASCENENFVISNKLVGKWSYTTEASPQGIFVYELTINDNFSFLSKINSFGIYSGQNNQDLSGWSEFSGSLEEGENTLIFSAENYMWWDSFYDMTPVSEESNQTLFDDCTYKVTSNSLELTYITYPADAPVKTKRKYIRVE